MTGASVRPRGSGARPVRGAADRPAGPTGRSCRMGLLLPHPHRNAVCLMPTTRVRGYCVVREEPVVRQSRRCSRSGCAQPAAATLTYVYAEST
ncbi:MAG TPA: DUF3499 family protein, partial [Geodermatophilus sp.]|nr:DUF3499 family protein [Geodermatophilus sp.]